MYVSYAGFCVDALGERLLVQSPDDRVADSGAHSFRLIAVNRIGESLASAVAKDCDIDVILKRERRGVLDPTYGQGGGVNSYRTMRRNITISIRHTNTL